MTDDAKRFTGREGLDEFLLVEWPDGTRHLAIRSVVGGTWSPPVVLKAVPVSAVADAR